MKEGSPVERDWEVSDAVRFALKRAKELSMSRPGNRLALGVKLLAASTTDVAFGNADYSNGRLFLDTH